MADGGSILLSRLSAGIFRSNLPVSSGTSNRCRQSNPACYHSQIVQLATCSSLHVSNCMEGVAQMEDTKVRKLDEDWKVQRLKRPRIDLAGLADCKNSSCRGTPKRFMFYEAGYWHAFPSENSAALCEAFCAGRGHVELFFRSCILMVSFMQKLQVNLHNGYRSSIGWVEECGKWNLPSHPFCGSNSSVCKQEVGVDASTSAGSQVEVFGGRISSRVKRLINGEQSYEEMKKMFQDGLGMLSPLAQVTGIYQVLYEGVVPQTRLQSFLECKQATELIRNGDANVQYAWYGCTKYELLTIVQHGFGKPTLDSPYGTGIYLAPRQYSHLSALGADVNNNDEQYTIFCKVILGRSELVSPGSKQFHPSSEEFDTGVDNLLNPKRFIVWSTHMNTHILPLNVVSFRLHQTMEVSAVKRKAGLQAPCPVKSKGHCTQAITTNPKLFALLKPELPSCDMQLLEQHYYQFKCGKLTQKEMLRKIRAIAGDAKLRRIQEQVQASTCSLGLATCRTHPN